MFSVCRNCLVFILPLFYSINGLCQTAVKDSLILSLKSLNKQSKYSNEDTLRIKYLNDLANYYSQSGDPDSAIIYFTNAQELAYVIDWEFGKAKLSQDLGTHFSRMGQYQLAITTLYNALIQFEKLDHDYRKAQVFRRIADNYSLLLETDSARTNYNNALYFYTKVGNERGMATTMHNMGNNERRAKNFSKAIALYEKSLPLYYKVDSVFGVADTYEEIAISLTYLNKFEKAEEFFLKALEVTKSSDLESLKAHIYTYLAKLYFKTEKYTECVVNAKKGLATAEKLNYAPLKLENYQTLFQAHKKTSDIQKALYYLEKLSSFREELKQSDQMREIKSLKAQYNLLIEQQANEKNLITLENRKRFIILMVLITVLLIAIIYVVYKSRKELKTQNKVIQNQKEQLTENNENLESLVRQRTIQLTKANEELTLKNHQISEALFTGQEIERKRVAAELHDNLGGTLAALKWRLSTLNTSLLSSEELGVYNNLEAMMTDAYNEVRNISHNLLPLEFQKTGLIGGLNKIVQQIQNSGKLDINLSAKGNFENLDKRIAFVVYSVCRELITNIIKHSGASKAQISINQSSSELEIYIEDNGKGFKVETSKSGKGLQSIRERIAQFNGIITTTSIKGKTKHHFVISSFNSSLGEKS